MRKLTTAFILLTFAALLTGCTSGLKLKSQETAAIAEYIAGAVLKYDKYYEGVLIQKEEDNTSSEVDKKPESEKPDSNKDGGNESGNSDKTNETGNQGTGSEKEVEYSTIDEVYNLKDFVITYKRYLITDEYPKNSSTSYFTMVPKKGRKNFVVEFTINNTSSKNRRIQLADAGIKYQLDINSGDKVLMPAATVLTNDINFLDMNIKAKKSKTAFIIFDVKKDEKLDAINLFITKKANTAIIKLK